MGLSIILLYYIGKIFRPKPVSAVITTDSRQKLANAAFGTSGGENQGRNG